MARSSIFRIAIAALAAFALSAIYYGVAVGTIWHELSGTSADTFALWQPVAQVGRNLVVAFALNYVLQRASTVGIWGALKVSIMLWLGFQAMAIAGSVIHENYPAILYCIHAFDALMTTVVMTLCLKIDLRNERRWRLGDQ